MNTEGRQLPLGIQSFEKLRSNHQLYVDKTEYLYRLVQSSTPCFLSRPRRFGKSLFLSMTAAYWEGKRDLFRGLKIEKLEENNKNAWQAWPVFYFDFNRANYQNDDALEKVLDFHLTKWEEKYAKGSIAGGHTTGGSTAVHSADRSLSLEARFASLLEAAHAQTGKRCVILVDEYDKPLIETMETEARADHNKAVFKGFFSILKSEDVHIQFVLITGVTKFNKVSIFSDINQLEDISFDREFAGICGITDEELRYNFLPEIAQLAAEQKLTGQECLEKLRVTYDGYHFASHTEGIYNPYSLLSALKKRRFGSFWFETGTPTFLVKKLRNINFDVRQFDTKTIEATERMLSDYRVDNPDPVPLLFQTGYLTIVGEDAENVYTLGFPNEEVRDGTVSLARWTA